MNEQFGYAYDAANQLVRVTVTNGWRSKFVYDGLGRRRISKDYTWSGASWTVTNEVRYVWDGMTVLQERDGANVVKVSYTRGLDLSGTMQAGRDTWSLAVAFGKVIFQRAILQRLLAGAFEPSHVVSVFRALQKFLVILDGGW